MPFYVRKKRSFATAKRPTTAYRRKSYVRRGMTKRKSFSRSKFKSFRRRKGGLRRISTSRMKDTYQSDKVFVRLKYKEPTYTASQSLGTLYEQKYAINDIFDPYLGVGGGQPSGYATMYANYRYAICHGAKITVTVSNTVNQNDNCTDICIVPYAAGNTTASTFETACEQPYAIKRTLNSAKSGNPQVILKQFITTRKIEGQKNLRQDLYETINGVSPANIAFWSIFSQTSTGQGTGLNTFTWDIRITYYCEFYGRENTPASIVDSLIKDAKASGKWDELIHKDDEKKEAFVKDYVRKPFKYVIVTEDETKEEKKVPETPRKPIPVKKSTR